MKRLISLFAVAATLLSCQGSKENLPLEGTQWNVVEMESEPLSADEDTFYLILDASQQMLYSTGACNRIFGTYEFSDDGLLSFGSLASTRMACPDGELESRFSTLLEQVDTYAIDGDKLTLYINKDIALVCQGTPFDIDILDNEASE
jgi:heat shock protein HslJ